MAMMVTGTPAKAIIAVPPMIEAHERRTKGHIGIDRMLLLSVLHFMGFPGEGASYHPGATFNVSRP
ncbi:MAG: hypothetical protein ACU0B9_19645 [Limimaricola soesokkakensis]|uniref:hypothetical protein n=1 Tax=Limimaricola soesokkakensis TaxID=1343159 RepID=UPI00405A4BAF